MEGGSTWILGRYWFLGRISVQILPRSMGLTIGNRERVARNVGLALNIFFLKLKYIVELQCCVTAVQKRDSVRQRKNYCKLLYSDVECKRSFSCAKIETDQPT